MEGRQQQSDSLPHDFLLRLKALGSTVLSELIKLYSRASWNQTLPTIPWERLG